MLYFFLLLAMPTTPACVLWMDHQPVPNNYLAPTCPLDLMPRWDWYDLHLIDQYGWTLCSWPAADNLTEPPCDPVPANNYHIEVWLRGPVGTGCNLWLDTPTWVREDLASQCPAWLDEYLDGTLEVRGPFEIHYPPVSAPACTLPQVDNSLAITTTVDYEFLAGRLNWWGIEISPWEWQNRFDDKIRGAADAAGVPATLLKGMISLESQFWPLWTGDAGEMGWMQLTRDGADTALRHDPELFSKYCTQAIWIYDCTGYDLLSSGQRELVISELVKDLVVEGTPVDAADMAAEDLWTYAHILRAFACQAQDQYPGMDAWETAAVLYNAGSACLQGETICPEGQGYLRGVIP